MIHVFHIFKKLARIPKPHYTSDTRKAFSIWDNSIQSQNGYIKNDCLYLPHSRKSEFNPKRTGGLIIQDIIGYSGLKSELEIKRGAEKMNYPKWFVDQKLNQFPELFCFNAENRAWPVELFSIEKNDSGNFEIHLRYSHNQFYIGEPKRQDYKLFEMDKGKPIEIVINGKSDHTMTSGKQRTYSEYAYIIEYLGEVSSVEFLAPNKIEIDRKIPAVVEKRIDLRKILY